jgi:hypothetical protein
VLGLDSLQTTTNERLLTLSINLGDNILKANQRTGEPEDKISTGGIVI